MDEWGEGGRRANDWVLILQLSIDDSDCPTILIGFHFQSESERSLEIKLRGDQCWCLRRRGIYRANSGRH